MGPARVVDLAAEHPISRPAISKHLRLLTEAGLATAEDHGRERHYRLDRSGAGPDPRPPGRARHHPAVRRVGPRRPRPRGPPHRPRPAGRHPNPAPSTRRRHDHDPDRPGHRTQGGARGSAARRVHAHLQRPDRGRLGSSHRVGPARALDRQLVGRPRRGTRRLPDALRGRRGCLGEVHDRRVRAAAAPRDHQRVAEPRRHRSELALRAGSGRGRRRHHVHLRAERARPGHGRGRRPGLGLLPRPDGRRGGGWRSSPR